MYLTHNYNLDEYYVKTFITRNYVARWILLFSASVDIKRSILSSPPPFSAWSWDGGSLSLSLSHTHTHTRTHTHTLSLSLSLSRFATHCNTIIAKPIAQFARPQRKKEDSSSSSSKRTRLSSVERAREKRRIWEDSVDGQAHVLVGSDQGKKKKQEARRRRSNIVPVQSSPVQSVQAQKEGTYSGKKEKRDRQQCK